MACALNAPTKTREESVEDMHGTTASGLCQNALASDAIYACQVVF